MNIVTVEEKKDEKKLRQKTADFDFSKFNKKQIKELVEKMKKIMIQNRGVGLSANQIGLNLRFFVAQVPDSGGSQKFYALFNPQIIKISKEEEEVEEGCLSVPEKFGFVPRPRYIILKAFDKNARPVKIKAWGFLARVFQHEVDHLDGKLFIDKALKIHGLPKSRDKHETHETPESNEKI